MLFVGVDAHKSTSQITVMNEAGVILSRKRVNSTREGFQKALTGCNEPIKSVLEASYGSGAKSKSIEKWLSESNLK